jgi:hypothetical protein
VGEPDEKIEFEGEVMEALRGRMFRIQLDNGHEALGLSGRKDEEVSHPADARRPRADRALAV